MTPDKKPTRREKREKEGIPNEKEKDFIAVRWPSNARQPLKVAAAGHTPPLTMTEYLFACFNAIEDAGGLKKIQPGGLAVIPPRTDQEQKKRFQAVGERLFRTRDRRLIDCAILFLESATR